MFSSIFSALWRLIQSWMNIFSHDNSLEMNPGSIKINVRFGPDCVPLILDPSWSVKEMKEALAPKLNLKPSEVKIIFAGKELGNAIRIEDCDIGQQSILHAVKSNNPRDLMVEAEAVSPLETIHKLQLTEEEHRQYDSIETKDKKVHFYVYCNKDCKNVTPGKLRVRCSSCKLGTLTVLEDPCGWDDVLTPGRIKGICQQEGCNGDTAEFYFKCAETHKVPDNEDHCVALYLIKTNIFDVPCLACTDVYSPVLVFSCQDAHVMCMDCFKTYCHTKLNDRQFVEDVELGYTLSCPVGCANSYIKETHHFRILGEEQYTRYQRFATEEFVLQSGGVLCPQPGCGAGIIPDPSCDKVTCVLNPGCGYVFCKKCLQGYHLGDCIDTLCGNPAENAEFRVNMTQAERSRWDDPSRITIQVMTKPCPKCRTPTERDGGCMHMVCTRPQCGFEWCWVCQSEWTRQCMSLHWF